MSFLAFGTTVTLLIRHNGYVAHPAQRLRFSFYALLFSSDLKQRNLFLNLDLVIISLLSSFVIKGAWFALTYFFSGGACQSSDFLHASRKPIRSSFGMLLLDNSWLNLHERVHLKNSSIVSHFWKYVFRTVKVSLWQSKSPISRISELQKLLGLLLLLEQQHSGCLDFLLNFSANINRRILSNLGVSFLH